MDFASQLSKLQETASKVSSSSSRKDDDDQSGKGDGRGYQRNDGGGYRAGGRRGRGRGRSSSGGRGFKSHRDDNNFSRGGSRDSYHGGGRSGHKRKRDHNSHRGSYGHEQRRPGNERGNTGSGKASSSSATKAELSVDELRQRLELLDRNKAQELSKATEQLLNFSVNSVPLSPSKSVVNDVSHATIPTDPRLASSLQQSGSGDSMPRDPRLAPRKESDAGESAVKDPRLAMSSNTVAGEPTKSAVVSDPRLQADAKPTTTNEKIEDEKTSISSTGVNVESEQNSVTNVSKSPTDVESRPAENDKQEYHSPPSKVDSIEADDNIASKVLNSTNIESRKQMHHVTLLFVTIDDLPHEHIWRAWMEGKVSLPEGVTGSSNKTLTVSVICHAKYPDRIKSLWLRQRLLLWPGSRGRRRKAQQFQTSLLAGSDPLTASLIQQQPLQFQQQRDRVQSFRPEWGSLEITRAMIELLDEGLSLSSHLIPPVDGSLGPPTNPYISNSVCLPSDIPPSDRFIFVSETCLPITPLDELERQLYATDRSWLKAMNEPNNGYSRQLQWDKMSPAVPREKIWKSDQWIVLTRDHAQKIVDIPQRIGSGEYLWKCFTKLKASDELYFPTSLGLLGILRKKKPTADTAKVKKEDTPKIKKETNVSDEKSSIETDEIVERRVTYCDWSLGARNPASFKNVTDLKTVIDLARDEGCLFARKFVVGGRDGGQPIPLHEWADVIKSRMMYEERKGQKLTKAPPQSEEPKALGEIEQTTEKVIEKPGCGDITDAEQNPVESIEEDALEAAGKETGDIPGAVSQIETDTMKEKE